MVGNAENRSLSHNLEDQRGCRNKIEVVMVASCRYARGQEKVTVEVLLRQVPKSKNKVIMLEKG